MPVKKAKAKPKAKPKRKNIRKVVRKRKKPVKSCCKHHQELKVLKKQDKAVQIGGLCMSVLSFI